MVGEQYMAEIVLECEVSHDDALQYALDMYDIEPELGLKTVIPNRINAPDGWVIGAIVGASGAGKTSLLREHFQHTETPLFQQGNSSVISNISSLLGGNPEEAARILSSVGLSSVPAWIRPPFCLSNGETFRYNLACDIADAMANEKEIITIDEFTSVVDRNVAKAASFALQKFARKTGQRLVVASCHDDIVEWLNPDWVYNPHDGETIVREERGWSLRRPKIELKVFRAEYEAWEMFKGHHYMTSDLNKACRLFVATWDGKPVACNAILPFPNGGIQNGWRSSRVVVLPDYQGLGIAGALSEFISSMIKAQDGRLFARLRHPALANHRLNRPNTWKETAVSRKVHTHAGNEEWGWKQNDRECWSFEYVGEPSSLYDAELFWGIKFVANEYEWI